jgi:hypothetical protein
MLQRVVITKYCCTFFAFKLVTTKNSHRENFSGSICVLVVRPAIWAVNFISNFVSGSLNTLLVMYFATLSALTHLLYNC